MNARPNLRNAGRPPANMDRAIPLRLIKTKNAAAATTARNTGSPRPRLRACIGRAGPAGISAAVVMACCIGSDASWGLTTRETGAAGWSRPPCGLLDLAFPGRFDLRHERGGQRDVVELGGLLLAVLQRPAEKLERRGRASRILRLFIHDDEHGGRDRVGLGARSVG